MTVLDNIMLGRHVHMSAGVLASFVYWGLGAEGGGRATARGSRNSSTSSKLAGPAQAADRRARLRPAASASSSARALALDPKLLLLDEPMGGMNQEEKEDMARYILDVNEQWGTTIILIEHDMGVVMDISDRVAVLDCGRKIAEGTPDEVQRDPA